MFDGASAFNQDISAWNVGRVTDMSAMFRDTAAFNRDISSWNVSSAIFMGGMFDGASAFNQDISAWNVGGVTDMSGMFDGASAFNQPLPAWNVGGVTDMAGMFNGASSFDGDISSWDVSSVTDMAVMFNQAAAFNQDISSWDVGSVTDMSSMFDGAAAFEQNLGPWYVVPADAIYDTADTSLAVTAISAQNPFLDGQNPAYGIGTGHDSALFNVTGTGTLVFLAAPSPGAHTVNVTASGGSVFEDGNNWRLLEVEVVDRPTPVSATLYTGNATLKIVFGQPLNATIHYDRMYLREDGATSGGLSFYHLSALAMDSTLTATLLPDQVRTVLGFDTPTLDIGADAVFNEGGDGILAVEDYPVTIVDTADPVITLEGPNPMSVLLDSTFQDPGAICQDDVDDDPTITVNATALDTSAEGEYTVTYTCADFSGNTATTDRTVNVVVEPAITSAELNTFHKVLTITFNQPLDETIHRDSRMHLREHGGTSNVLTLSQAPTSEIDGSYFTFVLSQEQAETVLVVSNLTLRVEAFTIRSQNNVWMPAVEDHPVTIVDETDPVITLEGPDPMSMLVGDTFREPGAACEDDVDGTVPYIRNNPITPSTPPGTYQITYTCADSAGNTATATRTVNVVEFTITSASFRTGEAILTMTFIEPLNGTIHYDRMHLREHGETSGGLTLSQAPAKVHSGATVTVTMTAEQGRTVQGIARLTLDIGADAVFNLDGVGISSIADYPVATLDAAAPVVTLRGEPSVAVPAGGTYADPGAACRDETDGWLDDHVIAEPFYVDHAFEPGTYTITYTCTDSAGNAATATRTVTAVDQDAPGATGTAVPLDANPPTIALVGSTSVTVAAGGSYADPGASCSDDWDGDITSRMTTTSNLNQGSPGTYRITYGCADSAGNTATATRTVTVIATAVADTTPPVITFIGSSIINVAVGDPFVDPGASCHDETDGALPVRDISTRPVDTGTPRGYYITYVCFDAAGNRESASRSVVVQAPDRDLPPVLVVPPPVTITLGSTYVDPGATCTDHEDGDLPVIVHTGQLDTTVLGEQSVYYVCRDSAGNGATAGRMVTVVEP